MELRLECKWNEFLKEEKRKEIICFGASSCFQKFTMKLNDKFIVKMIIDNDASKKGLIFNGVTVVGSEIIDLLEESDTIVITSTYYNQIIEQLYNLKFKGRVYSFLHLRGKIPSEGDFNAMKYGISDLKSLLEDEKSKSIVDQICDKRKNNISDYSDICEGNQYFLKDIVKTSCDEVFIDAGAFDGETVTEFIEFVDNKFLKVYSFEMDKMNFENIDKKKYDERVDFDNEGLWNKNEAVSYLEGGAGTEIVEDANCFAQCVKLDDVIKEKVTFIKMDIEGAEMNAIEGAKTIIMRDHPKLAICLYHKFDDLWKIPIYIHKLVPEYKLFIRHHGKNHEETVLYAIL